ncbi:MAG: four helix bundle protein [Bacteroidota bacterium]
MANFEKFEDILAWQKARVLTREIYDVTSLGNFAKDYGLKDQIRRAAVSIMLNISEGYARRSNNEFRQFLYIAHGSAAEVQSALYVALDQNYITDDSFKKLYEATQECSKIIAGLIRHINTR